jgi:hypothetical protein
VKNRPSGVKWLRGRDLNPRPLGYEDYIALSRLFQSIVYAVLSSPWLLLAAHFCGVIVVRKTVRRKLVCASLFGLPCGTGQVEKTDGRCLGYKINLCARLTWDLHGAVACYKTSLLINNHRRFVLDGAQPPAKKRLSLVSGRAANHVLESHGISALYPKR